MPIRRSLDGVRHPRPQLVAIAWNGWSRSIGTGGRNQSEQLVAITRCAQRCATRSARAATTASSPVKIFEAAEFKSETAGRGRSNLPKNVIGRADSLQNGFVILSAQR